MRFLASWGGGTAVLAFSGRQTGFLKRATVIIDEKQNVVFVMVYPVHSVPDISEVITVIKNLKNP